VQKEKNRIEWFVKAAACLPSSFLEGTILVCTSYLHYIVRICPKNMKSFPVSKKWNSTQKCVLTHRLAFFFFFLKRLHYTFQQQITSCKGEMLTTMLQDKHLY